MKTEMEQPWGENGGPADGMTEAELSAWLAGRRLGRYLDCHDTLDSTNNRAKRLAEQGAPEGTLVTAETQTAGKGRRGRSWISPAGTGIWFSLILRPRLSPSTAPGLTLAAALAAAEAVDAVCGLPVRIKWPNDLVLSGKKVCGILTEMSAGAEQVRYVVVGIGINANMTGFPPEIEKTATSLYLESGKKVRRTEVVGAVMERMESRYREFLETPGFSRMKDAYTARLANLGRRMLVLDPAGDYQGTCEGIDDKGQLLVSGDDGSLRHVMSGEVSVRGIYGYV